MAENNDSGGFWNSAFWQSWIGKLAAVIAAAAVLPQDRVLAAAGSAMSRAGSVLRDCADDALNGANAAQVYLRRWVGKLARWTTIVLVVSLGLCILGVVIQNKWVVFAGGAVSAIGLIVLYVTLRVAVKTLSVAIRGGVRLVGSTSAGILAGIGMQKAAEALESGVDSASAGLKEIESAPRALLFLSAIPVGAFALGHLPHWAFFLVLVFPVALSAMNAGLISEKIGDKTDGTWRLIKRVIVIMAVYDIIMTVWLVGSPHTYATFGPGHIYKWLENPAYQETHNFVNAGWVGTIAIIGIVAGFLWILAARIGGKVGDRMTSGVMVAAITAIIFVFVSRGPFTGSVKEYTRDDASSASMQSAPTQVNSPRPASSANFGAVTTKAPGDVPYVPKKKRAKKTAHKAETRHAPVRRRPVKHTPKQGDGYDEATALLDAVGL